MAHGRYEPKDGPVRAGSSNLVRSKSLFILEQDGLVPNQDRATADGVNLARQIPMMNIIRAVGHGEV